MGKLSLSYLTNIRILAITNKTPQLKVSEKGYDQLGKLQSLEIVDLFIIMYLWYEN